ncbi:MAG: M24 family metallopeptidase, partial [Acidimicrobiia bacterium]|nr:M24 family metallopeptidase [Acidimicrobiia bacterium]
GQAVMETARVIKSPEELACMGQAIAVAEAAMARMRAALRPGLKENELWAILNEVNAAQGGEWIETRLLTSGGRTNPWFQECSDRAIRAGELVSFDTDMIGPFGYCADISRTWVCGAAPTANQQDLFARAREEIAHNTALLAVGASFAELSQRTFRQRDDIAVNRYACAFHGVGLSDEYPKIPYPQDWETTGYDGEIEDGTVLSVESYVGPDGGTEGVKLEQMVQVNGDGVRLLSRFPTDLVPDVMWAG